MSFYRFPEPRECDFATEEEYEDAVRAWERAEDDYVDDYVDEMIGRRSGYGRD